MKADSVNFYKFLIDPDSFGHTVENVFHFAFLIKDGQASLQLAEDGAPMAGMMDDAWISHVQLLLNHPSPKSIVVERRKGSSVSFG